MLPRKLHLLLFLLFIWIPQIFSQDVQLGIITDFEKSSIVDSIFQVITQEIDLTTGANKNVTLQQENVIYGKQDFQQAKNNYVQLSQQADVILLVGGISIKGALLASTFPIPTFGLGIIDPSLQGIPIQDGKSGVQNFSYIWSSQEIDKELEEFSKLIPFKNLAILADASSVATINQAKAKQSIDSLSRLLSATIQIVPVTNNISGALATIADNIDAVYLTEMYSKSPDQIREISQILQKRNIPSFSSTKWHVDNGILSCISDENGLNQAIRKLSIMVDEALNGAALAEMPVVINFKEEFFLNLQTAKDIDFSPPFEVLFTATLIKDDMQQVPTYSLEEIMQRALEKNLDIKVSYQDIALSVQDIRSARSGILPQLDLSLTGVRVNEESANAFTPEQSLNGQLALNQILFSEEVIAGIKLAHYANKAQEYDTEAEVLNILFDTYVGYFSVLAAKTDLTIQQENLTNSKINLELAKNRVSVGAASNAEVYRWESELATAKQAVIQAQTTLFTVKYQLNTFLANTLEEEFDIEDITIDDEVYQEFSNNALANSIKTPKDLALITDFMVQEALLVNPNKKFLLENIKAAERSLLQNKRLLYTPNLALQAQTGRVFDRGGAGSEETPGFPLVDDTWQVGLSLSYPIFQGYARRANLQRSKIQLEQLDFSNKQLDLNLELAIKTNVLNTLNTTTNITFSKIAADNAQQNFELVQDNYQQGQVTITQLIDAQRAALQARLGYALSIYDYMQAQLQLEFAIGFFSKFASQTQLDDFEERFLQYQGNK
ncbi:MAG: TolC family protein [Bacteroidota bacterium]